MTIRNRIGAAAAEHLCGQYQDTGYRNLPGPSRVPDWTNRRIGRGFAKPMIWIKHTIAPADPAKGKLLPGRRTNEQRVEIACCRYHYASR